MTTILDSTPPDRLRILATAENAIAGLGNSDFGNEVSAAFHRERASIQKVEECFEKLTSRAWSRPVLERFFHAWRDTHLTSNAVAAMTCRLMALAEQAEGQPDRAVAFFSAASETGKIIHEDLGLCGEAHAELYYRLATNVCEGDEWERRRNRVPSAFEFRKWVLHQRVIAQDIQDGLETTIASEIYNHGEYTFAAPLFAPWLAREFGFTDQQVKRDLAYIVVHTGDTESGHFRHGVQALEYYCYGAQVTPDPIRLGARCSDYLRRVGDAFAGISARLN
ncbi:hypothetical protein AZL_c04190 (plasmid) [Azospirillum sp. B510]|uniref:hypothetical protein n=1 Tax=Azospirillum sp. (strain B510) TaxID=137722 RepID=UPI0001C4C966|nr:hypothetical protein [Azospirillum sp. B510]BAI75712.1 hypothetical protein AZL_c04190 [Azospirillum sp. B510]